jgi:hypothetical protein
MFAVAVPVVGSCSVPVSGPFSSIVSCVNAVSASSRNSLIACSILLCTRHSAFNGHVGVKTARLVVGDMI